MINPNSQRQTNKNLDPLISPKDKEVILISESQSLEHNKTVLLKQNENELFGVNYNQKYHKFVNKLQNNQSESNDQSLINQNSKKPKIDKSAIHKLQKERISNYTNVIEKQILENSDNLQQNQDYNSQFKQEFSLFPDLFNNFDAHQIVEQIHNKKFGVPKGGMIEFIPRFNIIKQQKDQKQNIGISIDQNKSLSFAEFSSQGTFYKKDKRSIQDRQQPKNLQNDKQLEQNTERQNQRLLIQQYKKKQSDNESKINELKSQLSLSTAGYSSRQKLFGINNKNFINQQMFSQTKGEDSLQVNDYEHLLYTPDTTHGEFTLQNQSKRQSQPQNIAQTISPIQKYDFSVPTEYQSNAGIKTSRNHLRQIKRGTRASVDINYNHQNQYQQFQSEQNSFLLEGRNLSQVLLASSIQTQNGRPDHLYVPQIKVQKTLAKKIIDKSYKQIQNLYEKMGAENMIKGDLRKLQDLKNLLDPEIKDKFMKFEGHKQLIESINNLNKSALEIFDQVSCYRIELGICLTQLLTCFSFIFVEQYSLFNQSEIKRNSQYLQLCSKMEQEHDFMQKCISESKTKEEEVKKKLELREKEIIQLIENEKELTKEIKIQNELLEQQRQAGKQKRISEGELHQAQQELKTFRVKKRVSNQRNTKEGQDYSNQESNEQILNKANEEHSKIIIERQQNLLEIQKTIKTMMKQGQQDAECQTDLELSKFLPFKDDNKAESKTKAADSLQDLIDQEKKFNISLKKQQKVDSIQKKYTMLSNENLVTEVECSSENIIKAQSFKQINQNEPTLSNEQAINKIICNKKQNGIEDFEQTVQKHRKLNDFLDQQIKKELEKIKLEGDDLPTLIVDEQVTTWALPTHIIVLLSNTINLLDKYKLKLEDWTTFKQTIIDIYDHRVGEHSQEINCAINNSYMTLDEHLIVYFCFKSSKEKQTSQRPEIEIQILEFIFALKYYSSRWIRAKLYAQMLGFLRENTNEINASSQKRNSKSVSSSEIIGSGDIPNQHQKYLDGLMEDHDIPMYDIYLQEYFFYAYCFLSKDRKQFIKTEEGRTFLKISYEQRQTLKTRNFLFSERQRGNLDKVWESRIKNNIKKKRFNQNEEIETEYIEFDLVLSFYIDEYKQLRSQIQRNLRNQFNQILKRKRNGIISLKEILNLLRNLNVQKGPSPTLQYAQEMSFIRAFIFGITCGQNDKDLQCDSFIAGCYRFGVDNPCPIISRRLSIYGNLEEIEKDFKKTLARMKEIHPENLYFQDIDEDIHHLADFKIEKKQAENAITGQKSVQVEKLVEFDETDIQIPLQKISGLINMNFLKNAPKFDRNYETIQSQSLNEILDQKQRKEPNDIKVLGVTMKIKDIKNAALNTTKFMQSPQKQDPHKSYGYLSEQDLSLIQGMTPEVLAAFKEQNKKEIVKNDFGISLKNQLVVPSFSTTSQIFTQHLAILRELKHKILLLRKSYEFQRNPEQSWKNIDKIVFVIEKACEYLDYISNDKNILSQNEENLKEYLKIRVQENDDESKIESKKEESPSQSLSDQDIGDLNLENQ